MALGSSPQRGLILRWCRTRSPFIRRAFTSRANRTPPSAAYFADKVDNPAVTTTPCGISQEQRHALDRALRVDQAGELAANYIYMGQAAVLGRDPTVGPLIQASTVSVARSRNTNSRLSRQTQDMWSQEKKHLEVMNKLQLQHRVRPTLLSHIARIGGYGLGTITALMGKEAAMACTEAVETVIGEHYDDQLKEFENLPESHPSVPLLKGVIEEFRDDELEHLDVAVENHSQRAPAHALLSTVVGAGCKVAIELCKRI
ncbi:uncharacterized protein FIBRA_09006 [Fibroporia radiculosa]|uniref:5-demethoxyubiquinone hydroxylase, mitochondrial n=1 Tax=Fibroporia radiculosa TaxID=599839 RepID=J4ICN4_9APHY|nr:uncharacterized protein FIBRA_09006 [Fibroporia radiculosa]CCM06716.1 predicted protein [Fibroporia radiculosa]